MIKGANNVRTFHPFHDGLPYWFIDGVWGIRVEVKVQIINSQCAKIACIRQRHNADDKILNRLFFHVDCRNLEAKLRQIAKKLLRGSVRSSGTDPTRPGHNLWYYRRFSDSGL